MKYWVLVSFVLVTASVPLDRHASGQSGVIVPLDSVDSVYRNADGYCLSPDGSQAGGAIRQNAVTARAVRWTADGVEDLGTIGGADGPSVAAAISGEGTIVGWSTAPGGIQHAFRWTSVGGIQDLGTIGGASGNSYASDVTPDGSVIVGMSNGKAFRWTSAGMTALSGDSAYAYAVSFDGAVVVGNLTSSHAFRWTAAGGMQDLGSLAGNGYRSYASDVSADGKVVVGRSQTGSGLAPERAFRWTAETGMQELGGVAGDGSSDALAVSADGRVVMGKSGVRSCIWYDDGPQYLDDLLDDFEIDRSDWSSLVANDCSPDGTILVGSGYHSVYDGEHGERYCGFRLELPVQKPTATPLETIDVECEGEQNLVTLTTTVGAVDDEPLTVNWSVDGIVRRTVSNVARDTTSTFTYDYSDGRHDVLVSVQDRDARCEQATTVTVSDTTDPIVVVSSAIKLAVDTGKLYATDPGLPLPIVSDVCDPNPAVSSNAPSKFPLGSTIVTWTVSDAAGNVATATQEVKVVNQRPRANAGPNISKTTTSDSVRLMLNGSRSSDPDLHALRFAWSSNRVRLKGKSTSRPSGVFPIGRTTVTLTVTDPAGAKATDRVVVTVKRKRARRSNATQADAHLQAAIDRAIEFASRDRFDAAAASGLTYSQAAQVYGSLAGDEIGADGDEASVDELITYGALRNAQIAFSLSSAEQFLGSFADSGDPSAVEAAEKAYRAAAYGLQDLSSY